MLLLQGDSDAIGDCDVIGESVATADSVTTWDSGTTGVVPCTDKKRYGYHGNIRITSSNS